MEHSLASFSSRAPPSRRPSLGVAGESLLAAALPERADISQTGDAGHDWASATQVVLIAVAQGHWLEVRRYRGLVLPDR
jgi:hypothetical protein